MTLTISGVDGRVAEIKNLTWSETQDVLVVQCRAPGPGVVFVCVAGECVKVVSLRRR